MNRIFGIPADNILFGLAASVAAILVFLFFMAGKGALFFKIGVRNVPRRPLRTVLVTFGLALSTAVLSSAILTGDTMTYNIRSLVSGTVGRVDELVVLYRREPQRRGPEDIVGIVTGQLIAGSRSYFNDREYERIRDAVAGAPGIASLTPAIVEPMVAANPASQTAGTHINVVGLPKSLEGAFDDFTDVNGPRIHLRYLGENEVLVNTSAAALLEARAGDPIRLYFGEDRPMYTIGAVVETPGLGAEQPAVIIPLDRLQARLGKPGSINRILVANTGDGVSSVDQTDQAVQALRVYLVRDDVAAKMHDFLHNDVALAEIAKARDQAQGSQRAKLEALFTASQRQDVTPEFKSILGDPEIVGRIAFVAFTLRGTPQGNGLNEQLRGLTGLTVIDLKRSALDRADEYGAVLTSIFLVVGVLSIIAALALVFLVFILLTAERRSEIGISRAVGMLRHQLVATYLFEGLAYDLAGALVGVGIGVGVGYWAVTFVSGLLTGYGVAVVPYTSARSLGISYLTGVILTFVSVGGAALYASRLNIVAAIRDLAPEKRGGIASRIYEVKAALSRVGRSGQSLVRRSVDSFVLMIGLLRWILFWLVGRGPGPLAAAFALRAYALSVRDWSWFVLAVTLGVFGVVRTILPALELIPGWARRTVLAVFPSVLLLYWLQELDFWGLGRWPFTDPGVAAYALRSVAIVVLSIWLAALLLPVIAKVVSYAISPIGPLLPAVRIALMYPSMRPWRTAFAMGMFAQVVFTMVLSAVLLNVALNAYGDPEKSALGYDIRGEPASAGAPPDVRSGFTTAAAIKESDFTAIGTLLTTPADILNLSGQASSWSSGSVYVLDQDFLDGIPLKLAEWSPSFSTSDDAWNAVRSQPGLALISSRTAGDGSDAFKQPYTVWIRDPKGGKPAKLTVIGSVSAASGIPAGVVTTGPSVAGMTTEVRSYFFKVRPDMRVEEAELGLSLSFGDSGLKTQIVGEEARRAAAIRSILTYLLEVFLALGLIAGLAALGILGVMAVIERRSQIGVMRAIGYQRWLVVTSFVIESMVVAGIGIAVGAIGGIVVARDVALYLAKGRPEIRFDIPFGDLGIILAVAFVAALITAALPALQAGRVPPSEAIKAGA